MPWPPREEDYFAKGRKPFRKSGKADQIEDRYDDLGLEFTELFDRKQPDQGRGRQMALCSICGEDYRKNIMDEHGFDIWETNLCVKCGAADMIPGDTYAYYDR